MSANLLTAPTQSTSHAIWEAAIKKPEHHLFYQTILSETIDALLQADYPKFDAQTTSNCCHGLSILLRELILSAQELPLATLKNTPLHSLPDPLIDLASLYVLTLIITLDPTRGRRTTPLNLQKKAPLPTSFCEKLVKRLQRSFSNYIAERYKDLDIHHEHQDWQRYTKDPFVKVDRKGVKYASCMFSMQVSLSHLSKIGATIAIVNDLIDPDTHEIKDRYYCFLKNQGDGSFSMIENASEEPIIVFGGYSSSSNLDLKSLSFKMTPWVHQVSSLILACDTHYPQFPAVEDDPSFDSSPITPTEPHLNHLIETHAKVSGVSAQDSSLFCLSHIFVASAKDIPNRLPSCYIPCLATTCSY